MVDVLIGILIIVVAAFVVRRLLGIDRGRWLVTIGAVIVGEAAATPIVSALYGGLNSVPAQGIVVAWALVTIFAMLVVVLAELLTSTRFQSSRRGIPRPFRQLRLLTQRALRYIEVARIVIKRGLLRPGSDADAEMRGSRLGRSLRLTFEDHGPGIPNVEQALKDGFTTGNGLGLGLSGARRLSQDFELTSAVGEGTRVVIGRWK